MRGLRASMRVVLPLIAATALCVILTWGLVSLPFGLLQRSAQANAGNAFNGAAAVGSTLVLFFMVRTLHLQEIEQREQREELRLQREVLQEQCAKTEATNSELHRTSEALLRSLHMRLMRLAMEDEEIAVLWPSCSPDAPPGRNKQFLYIHQVLNLHLLALESGYPATHIEATLAACFALPTWRVFWESTRPERDSRTPPGTTESEFFTVAERAYQAALAAVPLHGRRGEPSFDGEVPPGMDQRFA
jgi:hypothetical protein